MIRNILTAEIHQARSRQELRTRHEKFLVQSGRRKGIDIVPHTVAEPVLASINHGVWSFRCTCRAGVAAHPEWDEARCFGCGAVYTAVRFPQNHRVIEAALLARPHVENRNWRPGETVAELLAENIANGVRKAT